MTFVPPGAPQGAPPSPPPVGTPSAKVVLQAHATRSVTAMSLLLHSRSRSPLAAKSTWGPLLLGILLTVLIVAATAVALRVGALIPAR